MASRALLLLNPRARRGAEAAGAAGLDYPRLIERIVDLALARRKGKK